MQWFIDFDDTLVIGPVTWAISTVLPALIRDNTLPYDPAQFDAVLLRAQAQAANGSSEMEILDAMFTALDWPHHLQDELVRITFSEYTPALFDDSLIFLKRMGGVYLLSNNNYAPEIAQQLGISPYIKRYFTPKLCSVKRGKPQIDLWSAVSAAVDTTDAVLVGDDPWSDGAFSDACGIDCLLVDRLDRFGWLKYRRVRSLLAIPDASGNAVPE
jgi:FMN phosphatase YigB (HAD superfamily)